MATHAPLLHRPAPAPSAAPDVTPAPPATHGTLPSWPAAGLAITPGAVLQGYFKGANGAMSEQDLATAIAAHPQGAQLTPAMHGEIRRRHGHAKQGYHLHNTIAGLVSGSVAPKQPAAAGPKPQSRRVSAGLVNLPHMHANMMPLFEAAANTPPPVPAVRSLREHLESPTRNFNTFTPTHTQPPVLVQGHGNTVMGHGPQDAVDFWNTVGHTQPRADNQAHNSSAAVFHGLEEYHASAQSGGQTKARYRSPSPTDSSDPSYWDRSHPGFNPAAAWHSYANATDAQNGIRYVPPMTAAIVPQAAAVAKPTPVHAPPPQAAAAPSAFPAAPAFGAPSPVHSAFAPSSAFGAPSLKPSAFSPPSMTSSPASPMSNSGSAIGNAPVFAVPSHNAAPYQSSAPSYQHAPAQQSGFGFTPPQQFFPAPSFGTGASAFHQAPPPQYQQPPPLPPSVQYRPAPLEPLFGLTDEDDLGPRKMEE